MSSSGYTVDILEFTIFSKHALNIICLYSTQYQLPKKQCWVFITLQGLSHGGFHSLPSVSELQTFCVGPHLIDPQSMLGNEKHLLVV